MKLKRGPLKISAKWTNLQQLRHKERRQTAKIRNKIKNIPTDLKEMKKIIE